PTRKLAGVNGYAETGAAGDVKSADIVTWITKALLACHAETRNQRMTASNSEARSGFHRFDAEMADAGDNHPAFYPGLVPRAANALAKRIRICERRETCRARVIRRYEDFGIEGAFPGKAGQIVLGQQRIVLFCPELVGRRVIGGEKTREIVPDESAVPDEG